MTTQFHRVAICRQCCLAIILTGLLFAWSNVAWGHAHPEHMTPAADAILQQGPQQVTIRFSEDLEPAFSSIDVTNEQGESVDAVASQVNPDKPKFMAVQLKALQPGSYIVHWHAVARDGHTTAGSYMFQVQ